MRYLVFFIIAGMIILSSQFRVFSEDMHTHHHEEAMGSHGKIMDHHKGIRVSGALEDDIRVVKVKAFKYSFDPDPIVVRVDEKVRLELKSTDVDHGVVIKDFDISLIMPVGKTVSVEFTPRKTGAFRIYCRVYCGSGHGSMYGILVVIE